MNTILLLAALAMGLCVTFLVPRDGAAAIVLCTALTIVTSYFVSRVKGQGHFLLQIFIGALLVRMLVGTAIFITNMQEFFGGDAFTYDTYGEMMMKAWQGQTFYWGLINERNDLGWGMHYLVGAVYTLTGRNMLAVQYVNAVIGAATVPVIYLCAQQIFQNLRVSRLAACAVAFYPSLVLWSSQGLKDGPMIFFLAVCMLMTLKLGERISFKHMVLLLVALVGVMSLRFYIFYMMIAAIGGALVIGMTSFTAQSLARQMVIIVGMGLAMTQFGVLNSASQRLGMMSLETLQTTRSDLARSAGSGFAKDVDVSTTQGALSVIPLGLIYLLFAPFPWQLVSLRQSITLPEMIVWWGSFPLLVMGLWFTVKYRMRQALPILIFTSMLTLAYSVFQGNVGTAYRQRSQLLVFYFIFVAVGYVLLKEKQEDRKRAIVLAKQQVAQQVALKMARRKQDREFEEVAERLSKEVGF